MRELNMNEKRAIGKADKNQTQRALTQFKLTKHIFQEMAVYFEQN